MSCTLVHTNCRSFLNQLLENLVKVLKSLNLQIPIQNSLLRTNYFVDLKRLFCRPEIPEDVTKGVTKINQCLFPVHISVLIDAGVDPAERYKLEQAAVQLIMPYQGQNIRFYYVGTRYDQIRRKFIVNKGTGSFKTYLFDFFLENLMIKHDDLIEEIRFIRRSVRQEFFDHSNDLVDSAKFSNSPIAV